MKHRFLTVFLTAALIFTAMPVSAASQKPLTEGDFQYTVNGSEAAINGYLGKETVVTVPDEIGGKPVTAIADEGLSGNKYIETLILPDGITQIGERAICNNDNLKEIVFPDTLKTIGYLSFSYDKALTELRFPEGLEALPNNIAYTCYALTDIYIPSTVTQIGKWLAVNCFATKGFHVDEKNEFYCDVDGILYSKDMTVLVRYPSDLPDTTFRFPELLKEIAPSAFMTVRHLETLDIPGTVTKIGDRAFEGCAHLKSLKLPRGMQEIPTACLISLYYMEALYIPKSVTKISANALRFFESVPTIYYEGSAEEWAAVTIEEGNIGFNEDIVFHYDFISMGDINGDGFVDQSDVCILHEYLLTKNFGCLFNSDKADLDGNGRLDARDLTLLKRMILF